MPYFSLFPSPLWSPAFPGRSVVPRSKCECPARPRAACEGRESPEERAGPARWLKKQVDVPKRNVKVSEKARKRPGPAPHAARRAPEEEARRARAQTEALRRRRRRGRGREGLGAARRTSPPAAPSAALALASARPAKAWRGRGRGGRGGQGEGGRGGVRLRPGSAAPSEASGVPRGAGEGGRLLGRVGASRSAKEVPGPCRCSEWLECQAGSVRECQGDWQLTADSRIPGDWQGILSGPLAQTSSVRRLMDLCLRMFFLGYPMQTVVT